MDLGPPGLLTASWSLRSKRSRARLAAPPVSSGARSASAGQGRGVERRTRRVCAERAEKWVALGYAPVLSCGSWMQRC